MGVDARIESEMGDSLAAVADPRGDFVWALGMLELERTVCLSVIDPYGHTVFNQRQLPVLLSELENASRRLNDLQLQQAKRTYLQEAASWPPAALAAARARVASLSLSDVQDHIARVASLVRKALELGAHRYVRFIGD